MNKTKLFTPHDTKNNELNLFYSLSLHLKLFETEKDLIKRVTVETEAFCWCDFKKGCS